ncbi:hypothetical protein NL676_010816 [Syzygium grande]|nr:hypothetical protein NL676_010816 [Syzygium grande]
MVVPSPSPSGHQQSTIAGHQTHAEIKETTSTKNRAQAQGELGGEKMPSRRIGFQKILHLHSLLVKSLTTTVSCPIANSSSATVKRHCSPLFSESSLPKYSFGLFLPLTVLGPGVTVRYDLSTSGDQSRLVMALATHPSSMLCFGFSRACFSAWSFIACPPIRRFVFDNA